MSRANTFWVPELGRQSQEDCLKLEARVEWVLGQPELQSDTLSETKANNQDFPTNPKTKGNNGASKNSSEDRVSLSL